ncbi:MAG: type II toxin-antitoxin system VapC family toxin [Chloroflexi bacterium]|nr:MAG: type II toxin-antitoxin system VapC family toxin [Chloroflexota bacterium]
MTYLVDSDWLISYLNGRADAEAVLGGLYSEGLAISVVTYGEVLEGFIEAAGSMPQSSQFESFVGTMDLLPVDMEVGRRYAAIRYELRRQGQLIADNDLWIAATGLAHDLTLVTRDRHFERVPGLKLYQQVR